MHYFPTLNNYYNAIEFVGKPGNMGNVCCERKNAKLEEKKVNFVLM